MITVKPTDPETYRVLRNDELVGFVSKTEVGFHTELLSGDSFELRTMKLTKERLDQEMFHVKQPSRKRLPPGIEEARRLGAISHTGLREYQNLARLHHPYLTEQEMGGFILRMVWEASAQWPWGETARTLLELYKDVLPKIKQVDWEQTEQLGITVYVSEERV